MISLTNMLIAALILVVLILGYTTFNLLRKNEKLEDVAEQQSKIMAQYLVYIDGFSKAVEYSAKRLQQIDEKGSFKSDDEIGWFFDQILSLQAQLNNFRLINLENDETKSQQK